MSLDVYLKGEEKEVECVCSCCYHTHTKIERAQLYEANITHNLGAMAGVAELYYHLWRPEELGITKAFELIRPLKEGLALLKSNPDKFYPYNPTNGWGAYTNLVTFVEEYLAACEEYPEATVEASR